MIDCKLHSKESNFVKDLRKGAFQKDFKSGRFFPPRLIYFGSFICIFGMLFYMIFNKLISPSSLLNNGIKNNINSSSLIHVHVVPIKKDFESSNERIWFDYSSAIINGYFIPNKALTNVGRLEEVYPNLQIIREEEMRLLYQTFKDLNEILSAANITYALYGGSLLGAIRHGGVIPWDNEGDIIMYWKDREKFGKLGRTLFRDRGYQLIRSRCRKSKNKKMRSVEYDRISRMDLPLYVPSCERGWVHHHPWIDIFYVEDKIDASVFFKCETTMNRLSGSDIQKSDLFPIKNTKFGKLHLPIPANPFPFMDKVYKNWNTTFFAHIHYQSEIEKRSGKWEITNHVMEGQYRRPGYPLGPLYDYCDAVTCKETFSMKRRKEYLKAFDAQKRENWMLCMSMKGKKKKKKSKKRKKKIK